MDVALPTGSAGLDKAELYRELLASLTALTEGEPDLVANLANVSALLKQVLPAVSWVGIYRRFGGELVLGPFQGKVACTRIAWGRGVCGQAALRCETLVVPDVHAFPDHIACDSASRSEIVVPVARGGEVVAVLDLDSEDLGRFDQADARGLEPIAAVIAGFSW